MLTQKVVTGYNLELLPFPEGQSFAMALASSLISSRGDGAEVKDKDGNVCKPDGKDMKGLEEEHDCVVRGKVNK